MIRRLALKENSTLLIDQVVCSASNATAILLATITLSGAELNLYVILQLVGTTAIGFQRSTFLDPSLVTSTNGRRCTAYAKWTVTIMAPMAVTSALITFAITADLSWAMVPLVLLLPCIQDCFRYRCMAMRSYAPALLSDGVWLVTLTTGMLIILPSTALEALTIWCGSGALASFFLIARGATTSTVSLGQVLRLGKFQVTEWLIANLTTLVPMFLVQLAMPQGSVAAFRLVQTAIGPLNTLNNFVMVKFLLGSGALQNMYRHQVTRTMRRTSLMLICLTVSYGLCLVAAFILFEDMASSELRGQLVYAVPVVIIGATITSPCTPYLGTARALGLQHMTILPRAAVLAVNLIATAVGFQLWERQGIDPLVVTTLMTAAASLVSYRIMAGKALQVHQPLAVIKKVPQRSSSR